MMRSGNEKRLAKIVREQIDLEDAVRFVQDVSAGGIDIFIGTTRNQSQGKNVLTLEYQAYEAMALKEMERVLDEACAQWSMCGIAIIHRIGRVDIGEASVIIAVSAEHRKEAFEACRYAIDTLKKNVPIWKKEIFADGEVWVGTQDGIMKPESNTST